jgi:hypothetical protein
MWFRHKPRQLIVEYYLHWTTTFEISFSCGSDTNHDSLLKNTTYTGPPRLRYLFYVVQTQTTTAYWRILPTLDHHVWDIFFMWFRHKLRQLIEEYYLHWTTTFEISFLCGSDTNYDSLLKNTTYTGPPRLRYLFHVVQTQTTTAYWRILPTLDHHVWDIFFMWFRHKLRQLIEEYSQTTAAWRRILPTLVIDAWDTVYWRFRENYFVRTRIPRTQIPRRN